MKYYAWKKEFSTELLMLDAKRDTLTELETEEAKNETHAKYLDKKVNWTGKILDVQEVEGTDNVKVTVEIHPKKSGVISASDGKNYTINYGEKLEIYHTNEENSQALNKGDSIKLEIMIASCDSCIYMFEVLSYEPTTGACDCCGDEADI
jgi:ATP-dependent 26S proteasome regulatory subunit